MKHSSYILYRRTFVLPTEWKGKRILLYFGAMDWEATVFVNGKEVSSHKGGYDAFTFDISGALDSTGKQELVIKVFDPTDEGLQPSGKQSVKPEGIYYTSVTGIW